MATSRKRSSATALLLVDFLHLLVGESGPGLSVSALRAARHAAGLKRRAREARIQVIYANDNFGNWAADFPALVEACRRRRGAARELARLLEPLPGDFSVLKPRHSAFYGTPLEFLLEELRVRRLIIAGMETDICVMYTAQDAYMRRFELWIPRNCVASRSARRHTAALAFMRKNLKANTKAASAAVTPANAFGH